MSSSSEEELNKLEMSVGEIVHVCVVVSGPSDRII